MAIELNSQGPRRYLPLKGNPLYYFNALQYLGGYLYRAILGFEVFWDKEVELALIKHLEGHYEALREKRAYYFEEIEFVWRTLVHGKLWIKGLKPEIKGRLHRRHLDRVFIDRGVKAICRIDRTKVPHLVDIDCDDGRVFTITFKEYENRKFNRMKVIKSEKPYTRPPSSYEKNGKRGETSETKNHGREESVKKMDAELSRLWKRQRWPYSVRKARQKVY